MKVAFLLSTLIALSVNATLSAGSLQVYVGYADNLRPSGFFPTPWLGSPGVVSQTPAGQSLDTGAVRIDNPGSTPVTITAFNVTFGGGQSFSIWNPLTIGPGQIGIFTQTASYNFDTSDFGLFGSSPVNVDAAHPLGGCTNPTLTEVSECNKYRPVVSFDAGSGLVHPLDSGHVLDTFGYDLINLPPPGGDGNESINWNLIGTTPSRGGTTPEPASALLMLAGVGIAVLSRRPLLSAALRFSRPYSCPGSAGSLCRASRWRDSRRPRKKRSANGISSG